MQLIPFAPPPIHHIYLLHHLTHATPTPLTNSLKLAAIQPASHWLRLAPILMALAWQRWPENERGTTGGGDRGNCLPWEENTSRRGVVEVDTGQECICLECIRRVTILTIVSAHITRCMGTGTHLLCRIEGSFSSLQVTNQSVNLFNIFLSLVNPIYSGGGLRQSHPTIL